MTEKQQRIIELYDGDNDLNKTQIADEAGASNGYVTETIEKYDRGLLPGPDAELVELSFTREEAIFIAQKVADGEEGLRITQKLLDEIELGREL